MIFWHARTLSFISLCARARACVLRSVYYSKFTARSSVPAVSYFTTRWSHCLALLSAEESDKDSNWIACLCDGLFSNRNYFVIKSNRVICSCDFHPIIYIWYLRVRAWIFTPPPGSRSFVISRGQSEALTLFHYSFTSFQLCLGSWMADTHWWVGHRQVLEKVALHYFL